MKTTVLSITILTLIAVAPAQAQYTDLFIT